MTTRRPLSPWAVLARLEQKVNRQREVRLTPDTALLLLQALRAYLANPRRDEIAAVICMRQHVKRQPCQPLCRRCRETAWELKCLMMGEEKVFGEEWDRR
ncbi:hypothetical protein K32_44400 [Kaistia sp. 32K]|nr:hypothetical protein K32_44400 [Kaistia sp. 32K]